MYRLASVKTVFNDKADAEGVRRPEHVEKVWDEAVDGAWAPGRAPVTLLTEFLRLVQEENLDEAKATAREILAVEPYNKLVPDLVEAMQQQHNLESQLESESESESEEDDDEEDDDNDEDGSASEEESPEHGDEKDRDEK